MHRRVLSVLSLLVLCGCLGLHRAENVRCDENPAASLRFALYDRMIGDFLSNQGGEDLSSQNVSSNTIFFITDVPSRENGVVFCGMLRAKHQQAYFFPLDFRRCLDRPVSDAEARSITENAFVVRLHFAGTRGSDFRVMGAVYSGGRHYAEKIYFFTIGRKAGRWIIKDMQPIRVQYLVEQSASEIDSGLKTHPAGEGRE